MQKTALFTYSPNPYPKRVTATICKHPFGMLMPGRTYSSEAYSYGFNGKEKDDEVSGGGNNLDFGARIYDSRLGRWMSRDPLESIQPSWSSYSFCYNNPCIFKDKSGKIPIIIIDFENHTIIVYQPVFVVSVGPGAISLEEINKLQQDFDQALIFNHLEVVNNATNETFDIKVVFQFLAGGTIEEVRKLNAEANKKSELGFKATWLSIDSDNAFEDEYLRRGGNQNPLDVGAFTESHREVIIRGNLATLREKIHEAFHLLLLKDTKNAVGIMKYTDGYGKGPGVNSQNLQDVLQLNFSKNIGNCYKIGNNGEFKLIGNSEDFDFSVQSKPDPKQYSGPGSGMGGIHLQNQLLSDIETNE